MLCSICSSINIFASKTTPTPHHASFHALFQAAEQGCELCRAIRVDAERSFVQSASDNLSPMDLDMDSQIIYYIFSTHGLEPTEATHSIWFFATFGRPKRYFNTQFELYVEHDCSPEFAEKVSGRTSFAKPYSDGCFALVKEWMRECLARHDGYCPSQIEAILPTRVLDVGLEGEDNGIALKIANPGEVGAYVTLSHCWGRGPHFRTLSYNIEFFERSLILEDLPLTFRDAILVTRKLGFRFIWIDSLCIIQDSHDDWVQEAALMHLYYKRSALTIAVDSAHGDQEGFLHLERENDHPVASFASTNNLPSQLDGVDPSYKVPIDNILLRRSGTQDKNALSERAWTLQETILSPRTVHYSATELKWECQKKASSERNRGYLLLSGYHKKGFLSLSNRLHTDLKSPGYKVFDQWYKILADYDTRALSISSDKLPAISGLAREFHSHTSATYKAGLWLEDISRGLIWSYFERGFKPDSYRAPSWSWAAMDCSRTHESDHSREISSQIGVNTNADTIIKKAKVLACEVILKDGDLYGAVLGGKLTLLAFYLPYPRKQLERRDGMLYRPPRMEISSRNSSYTPGEGELVCEFDVAPSEKCNYDDPEFYLDVGLGHIFGTSSYHYALLLKPAHGEGNEGKFIKIGIARFMQGPHEIQFEESGWVEREVTII
ncbi:HET-domain-containing protein [Stipitochalara longipes BDJ]|nr:HET-domain-containing protein [Stipitochalara longipes BDJ]